MPVAESDYLLASWDAWPVLGENRIVLFRARPGLWNYDYDARDWVDGTERFGGMWLGSPSVMPISKDQARRTIEDNGGRWVEPRKRKART